MKVEIGGSPAERMSLFFIESTEDPLERPVARLAGSQTHILEAASGGIRMVCSIKSKRPGGWLELNGKVFRLLGRRVPGIIGRSIPVWATRAPVQIH